MRRGDVICEVIHVVGRRFTVIGRPVVLRYVVGSFYRDVVGEVSYLDRAGSCILFLRCLRMRDEDVLCSSIQIIGASYVGDCSG